MGGCFSGKTWFRKQIQFFIVYKMHSNIVSENYPHIWDIETRLSWLFFFFVENLTLFYLLYLNSYKGESKGPDMGWGGNRAEKYSAGILGLSFRISLIFRK